MYSWVYSLKKGCIVAIFSYIRGEKLLYHINYL